MTEDTVSPPLDAEPALLRRHWRSGLGNLYRFLRGTGGLGSAFEAMFALAGPTVEREFNRFAADPLGQRLLAEHPRRELSEFLSDHDRLEKMPEGSFAHAYLAYMNDVGMASEGDFLAAAGLEEKASRFGWSADQLWFVRRMALSHDLFHVIAGYDRSIQGEIGVDAFTAGQIPLLPVKLLVIWFMFQKPSSPVAWPRFIRRAWRHGRTTPNLACVDYEAMLPLQLAEARRIAGVTPASEVHLDGYPELGSILGRKDVAMNGP